MAWGCFKDVQGMFLIYFEDILKMNYGFNDVLIIFVVSSQVVFSA